MRSEGAFKKTKWKPCNVKVTTTYLLYFKDLDNVSHVYHLLLCYLIACLSVSVLQGIVHTHTHTHTQLSKPDGMVLLNNVTRVDPHSSKDVAFSFEVHFKNTKTSPNSPWIFNTVSNVRLLCIYKSCGAGRNIL